MAFVAYCSKTPQLRRDSRFQVHFYTHLEPVVILMKWISNQKMRTIYERRSSIVNHTKGSFRVILTGIINSIFPSALKHMCSSKKKIKVEKKFKLTKTTEFLYNMHVSKYIIHMYMYIENKRGNEGWLVRIRESRPALRSQKVTSLVHNISLSKISQRLYQNTKKNWTEWPRLHVYGYAHHRSMYYS